MFSSHIGHLRQNYTKAPKRQDCQVSRKQNYSGRPSYSHTETITPVLAFLSDQYPVLLLPSDKMLMTETAVLDSSSVQAIQFLQFLYAHYKQRPFHVLRCVFF